MEKKFTRAMLCEEFGSKCKECPLYSDNNPRSLPCWLLDESDIQSIMKDYPYADVKARMMFNDIETRLKAVEERDEKKDEPRVSKGSVTYDLMNNRIASFEPERIIFGDYSIDIVDKKLYDKLEAKHEADCRLISEYDLENKKLEARCERLREMDKKRLFDLKNAENERDHYKCLYSFKCDEAGGLLKENKKLESLYEKKNEENSRLEKDYDALLSTMNSLQKNNKYKDLFHSLNHKHQKVVGEMKYWKERAIEAERNEDCLKRKLEKPEKLRTTLETENCALRKTLESVSESYDKLKADYYLVQNNLETTKGKLKETEEKLNDARILNKAREDVFNSNLKLKKTIEAKDRVIDLLRAELDKYKTDDECDDEWDD